MPIYPTALTASAAMIRAFFFTCGLFTALCGGALTCVDRVVLTEQAGRALEEQIGPIATSDPPSPQSPWRLVSSVRVVEDASDRRVLDPPDWAAFALLSAGGVTVLYALALPGRRADEEEDGEE